MVNAESRKHEMSLTPSARIALAFCFLLASPQVHACRGLSMEHTLFFETIPKLQPDADVIAKISLSDVNDGTATAKVVQVLRTCSRSSEQERQEGEVNEL